MRASYAVVILLGAAHASAGAYPTDCTALASTLSAAYRNATPFAGAGADLPAYLATHGAMLTMCIGPGKDPCAVSPLETHISASWISPQSRYGIVAGALLGYVVDPTALSMRCAYPVDAGTDGRDGSGCGPLQMDPTLGSKGAGAIGAAGRAIAALEYDAAVKKALGPGATWRNVTCAAFFKWDPKTDAFFDNATAIVAADPSAAGCAAMKSGAAKPKFSTLKSVINRPPRHATPLHHATPPRRVFHFDLGHTCPMWRLSTPILARYGNCPSHTRLAWQVINYDLGQIYGHPACNQHASLAPSFAPGSWWEYDASCSWSPSEWQGMVGWQRALQVVSSHLTPHLS